MLDQMLFLALRKIAQAHNTPGMPDFIRYQLQVHAEQLIEDNCSCFSVIVDDSRMMIRAASFELVD